MVAVSVIYADSDDEARLLALSSEMNIVQRSTGHTGLLPSIVEAKARTFTETERALVDGAMSTHLDGSSGTVQKGLAALVEHPNADEVMLSTRTHTYDARVHSNELIAQRWLPTAGKDRHRQEQSAIEHPRIRPI